MRIFIDTNIFFSAILFQGSIPYLAIEKTLSEAYEAWTSDYCLGELLRIIENKSPKNYEKMEKYLEKLSPSLHIHNDSSVVQDVEYSVRDKNDRTVIRSAIEVDSDIMITGDKDLLILRTNKPKIITPREFIDNY